MGYKKTTTVDPSKSATVKVGPCYPLRVSFGLPLNPRLGCFSESECGTASNGSDPPGFICKLGAAILDVKDLSCRYHANFCLVNDFLDRNYPQKSGIPHLFTL